MKNKKRKRVMQYHSSSSDDEGAAPPTKQKDGAQGTTGLETNLSPSRASEDRGVQRRNLDQDREDADENSSQAEASSQDSQADLDGEDEESSEDDLYNGSESDNAGQKQPASKRKKPKRNDPAVFASSISKILDSKLTTTKRADPVLSRSKSASAAAKEQKESKLEVKARRKMREDKKALQEKGHVRDVLGLGLTDVSTANIMEEEKRLKKTAQRGVVKLFNAVRAAQTRGEEAAREGLREGTVGIDKRQEKVNEMSKKGFLDLLVEGGKG